MKEKSMRKEIMKKSILIKWTRLKKKFLEEMTDQFAENEKRAQTTRKIP